MKIIMAEKFGFCYGVERAVQKVLESSKENKVYTYGPIIHNSQFVEKLEGKGVIVLEDTEKAKKGDIVIIRAHGVSPKVKKELEGKGAEIIDGTCPKVIRIQKLVGRLEKGGSQIIIIGKKDHPEIIGILGNIERGLAVHSKEDVEALDKDFEKVAVVVQTTEDIEVFKKIVKLLEDKFKNIEIFNTICDATIERQQGAIEAANESDCMIVIGGKHSSNTRHLADVCNKIKKTYYIETAEEINDDWFKDVKTVGMTAGASTPDYIISEVKSKIEGV